MEDDDTSFELDVKKRQLFVYYYDALATIYYFLYGSYPTMLNQNMPCIDEILNKCVLK